MLTLYDTQGRAAAVLENACRIVERQTLNGVDSLTFCLPENDAKAQLVGPFCRVRYGNGALYRIMPVTAEREETGLNTYQCEHVAAGLMDNVLFGYHVVGNLGVYTADVLRYILSCQVEKRWVLGDCDFARQFEYGFEQESLLSALFSVPKPFTEPYVWRFDTGCAPMVVHLKKLDLEALPDVYLRRKKNLLTLSRQTDVLTVCTRLYALGAGEGVNQIGIAGKNGGVPYLQSPPEIVAKYGIIERIWIDRRYTQPENLLAAARKMLWELQEPREVYEFSFALVDAADYERLRVGNIVDVEGWRSHITEIEWHYDDITSSKVTVANKPADLAGSVADMMDRQRVEMSYSQGATQIFAQSVQANADKANGAVLNFFIPEDMVFVNKVVMKAEVGSFRAYSRATSTAEAQSRTTSSQPGSTPTTNSSPQQTQTTSTEASANQTSSSERISLSTTEDGGGGSQTTAGVLTTRFGTPLPADASFIQDAPDHNHGIVNGKTLVTAVDFTNSAAPTTNFVASGGHMHKIYDHGHTVNVPAHRHSLSVPAHSHTVPIPGHGHTVTIPGHNHTVTIPAHDHTVTVPGHQHEITPGIYFFGNPQGFGLYVNGVFKGYYFQNTAEIELTQMLLNGQGIIPRGQFHRVEIRPDDVAYVTMDVSVQGFVQSRGGGAY